MPPHSVTVNTEDFDSSNDGSNPSVAAILVDLFAELYSSNWTISWAYQYALDEWRMSIIHESNVGAEQGTYISHCASATSFHSALEDCLAKRNEAEFEPDPKVTGVIDKSQSTTRLDLIALGLRPKIKIERRI